MGKQEIRRLAVKRLSDEVSRLVNDNLSQNMEPYELPTNTALKIKVRRVVMSAEWKWVGTTDDDSCGICRMPFDACCVECKVPGDECPVVSGVCTHMFHIHCIERWTDSQQATSTDAKPRCPLCRQAWEFKN